MTVEIKVPDIGDFKDIPIIEVHVQPGAKVEVDEPLITLESDKATMDIPAPQAGTVAELLVKSGDRVSEGSPILHAGGRGRRRHPAQGARPGRRRRPAPVRAGGLRLGRAASTKRRSR